ncbi:MAG: hypothetical protein LBB43_01350 [Spirochaetaceae bacterium]|jgi:hypothetical protein|nr:hypothetical protein [Spirochaetaceae bacterium]
MTIQKFAVIATIPALIAAGLLFFRSPVVLVTDAQFALLYGKERLASQRIELSLTLWRRVRFIFIAENINADLVVFAVESALDSPFCVLFPYRYADGAELYAEQFPAAKVMILGGRISDQEERTIPVVTSDFLTDLYRAGLCAALLAADNPDKPIVVFQDIPLLPEQQQAFSAGLSQQGYTAEPVFIQNTAPQDSACAVIIGSNQLNTFLTQNYSTPIILFSWIDPALSSRQIKLIFDDSDLRLAIQAIRQMQKQKYPTLPSYITIISERISQKRLLTILKNAVHSIRPR